jgi:hypothetical protein
MILQKLKRHKELLGYAVTMALLMLVLRWFEFRFLILEHQYEWYIGLIAVFFLLFGIWVANKITTPKEKIIVVEKEVKIIHDPNFIVIVEELVLRKISKRELEVLSLMAEGLSNNEIAEDYLFHSTQSKHIMPSYLKN